MTLADVTPGAGAMHAVLLNLVLAFVTACIPVLVLLGLVLIRRDRGSSVAARLVADVRAAPDRWVEVLTGAPAVRRPDVPVLHQENRVLDHLLVGLDDEVLVVRDVSHPSRPAEVLQRSAGDEPVIVHSRKTTSLRCGNLVLHAQVDAVLADLRARGWSVLDGPPAAQNPAGWAPPTASRPHLPPPPLPSPPTRYPPNQTVPPDIAPPSAVSREVDLGEDALGPAIDEWIGAGEVDEIE